MPQVGDDVALDEVPDRCGYAYSPGWAYEVVPGEWASVPPRARVLKLDLVLEDVLVNPGPLIAELEGQLQAVRDAWGCPETALVMAAYRFEV